MIVSAIGNRSGAPEPWLQIIGGSAMIVYWVYRVRKQWHTIGGGELTAAFVICVLAGIFLANGVYLLLRR
jgi:hypothetical protein